MPDNPNRKVTVPDNPGMVTDLVNRIKLIIRLLGDRRVSPLIKLLPIGSALYFIIPDLVLGPLDDAAIIWLATYLFVELCPPDLVDEHMRAIQGLPPAAASSGGASTGDDEIVEGEVIDAEFQDK
jgi:hypothetical protein